MKMKRRAFRVIWIILIVLAALAAAAWGIVHYTLSGGNYRSDDEVRIDKDAYETEEVKPEDIYHVDEVTLASQDQTEDTWTLLAIGGASPEIEESAQNRGDADAIILLTFNNSMKTLYINTFHADLYVHIPGEGPGNLGNSYAVGGGVLLCRAITENYGVPIDNYAVISLKDAARVMDMPGLTDADVSDRGVEVIRKLVNQLGISSPLEVAGRITSLLPYVTHNLTSSELTALMLKAPSYVSFYSEDYRIPYDGLFQKVQGYLVPDIAATSEKLKDTIYQKQQEDK